MEEILGYRSDCHIRYKSQDLTTLGTASARPVLATPPAMKLVDNDSKAMTSCIIEVLSLDP